LSDQAAAAAATEPTSTTTPTPETPATETATPQPNDTPASLLGSEAETAEEKIETPVELFDAEKVTFPEGMTKDDELFGEFTNLATEHKIPAAVAQALIDLGGKQAQAIVQKQQAEWTKMQEGWQAEIKADKELGGDKLPGHLQTFAKVARDPVLSDPKFLVRIAPVGNDPVVVRTLVRWANALSEGGPVRGSPASATRAPQSLGEVFYGVKDQ
jgi:hypothetical protein